MSKIQKILEALFLQAFDCSLQPGYQQQLHIDQIQELLSRTNSTLKQLECLTIYNLDQIVDDLLEITHEIRMITKTMKNYQAQLQQRTKKHFNGAFYKHLCQSSHLDENQKKIKAMYEYGNFIQSQEALQQTTQFILKNTLYFPGITKGNGVFISDGEIATCAHVVRDQQSKKIFKMRCFITGTGQFGIAKFSKQSIFYKQDVAIGKIIAFNGTRTQAPLVVPFSADKKPIKCIQIGLLFDDEAGESSMFESNAGFIEKDLYTSQNHLELNKEMGMLIHDCYGLHGTSGSPLWDQDGKLLGIHNSWNSSSRNISMIIHSFPRRILKQWYIIRQYERRAISSHVLNKFLLRTKEIPPQSTEEVTQAKNKKSVKSKKIQKAKK